MYGNPIQLSMSNLILVQNYLALSGHFPSLLTIEFFLNCLKSTFKSHSALYCNLSYPGCHVSDTWLHYLLGGFQAGWSNSSQFVGSRDGPGPEKCEHLHWITPTWFVSCDYIQLSWISSLLWSCSLWPRCTEVIIYIGPNQT